MKEMTRKKEERWRKSYAGKEARSHNRSGARVERKEARAISRSREPRERERERGRERERERERERVNERGNSVQLQGPEWRLEMVFAAGSLARSGKSEVRAEETVSASFPVN